MVRCETLERTSFWVKSDGFPVENPAFAGEPRNSVGNVWHCVVRSQIPRDEPDVGTFLIVKVRKSSHWAREIVA